MKVGTEELDNIAKVVYPKQGELTLTLFGSSKPLYRAIITILILSLKQKLLSYWISKKKPVPELLELDPCGGKNIFIK